MADDDQHNFRDDFQRSVETKQELFSYARLKCKRELVTNPNQSTSQKELLFEIKGHPHYMPEDNECKCFFAMAKLYPSRNTAMHVSSSITILCVDLSAQYLSCDVSA